MNHILLFLNVYKSFSSRMGIFALHQSSLPKLVVNSQKQKYFESYISKLHWKKNNYHHADIHDYESTYQIQTFGPQDWWDEKESFLDIIMKDMIYSPHHAHTLSKSLILLMDF